METTITYPQYRKYHNEKGYFKIISPKEWEEIQIVGSRYLLHRFTVAIFPDRNFVYDMTFDFEKNWTPIEQAEYEKIKERAKG